MFKIRCCQCGVSHKATSRNYPIARKGYVTTVDKKTKEKTTKLEVTGYLCSWCVRKHVKMEERKNAIKQQSQTNTTTRAQEKRSDIQGEVFKDSKKLENKKQGFLFKIRKMFSPQKKI